MPRTKIRKQPQSQEAKKVDLANNKMNTALGSDPSISRSQKPEKALVQVQSLDFNFLRWPRAGEQVFSVAGSPLAVLEKPELCAHAHIPTSKGVISVKPHQMKHMDDDTLKMMDRRSLNQVKALSTNLGMIVEMATKMGRL